MKSLTSLEKHNEQTYLLERSEEHIQLSQIIRNDEEADEALGSNIHKGSVFKYVTKSKYYSNLKKERIKSNRHDDTNTESILEKSNIYNKENNLKIDYIDIIVNTRRYKSNKEMHRVKFNSKQSDD